MAVPIGAAEPSGVGGVAGASGISAPGFGTTGVGVNEGTRGLGGAEGGAVVFSFSPSPVVPVSACPGFTSVGAGTGVTGPGSPGMSGGATTGLKVPGAGGTGGVPGIGSWTTGRGGNFECMASTGTPGGVKSGFAGRSAVVGDGTAMPGRKWFESFVPGPDPGAAGRSIDGGGRSNPPAGRTPPGAGTGRVGRGGVPPVRSRGTWVYPGGGGRNPPAGFTPVPGWPGMYPGGGLFGVHSEYGRTVVGGATPVGRGNPPLGRAPPGTGCWAATVPKTASPTAAVAAASNTGRVRTGYSPNRFPSAPGSITPEPPPPRTPRPVPSPEGRAGAGYLIAFFVIFAATASAKSIPVWALSRKTMFATSASSSAIASRTRGSAAAPRDSSGVSHRKMSHNSPTSLARARTRFFGVWYGSQSRAAANRRMPSLSAATGVVASGIADDPGYSASAGRAA